MRRWTRILCLLLAALLLPAFSLGEDGEAEEIRQYGPWWSYRVLEDGTAELTEYRGLAVHETIPSTIDGRTVTALSGSLASEWTQRIEIPATVTRITGNPFRNNNRLKEIILKDDTAAFRMENGMLISEAEQRLIFVLPKSIKGKVVLPEGIRAVEEDAFYNCGAMTSVTLPASLESIIGNPFRRCDKLKELKIAEGNLSVTLKDGMLLNFGEGKLIMALPWAASGEILIPDGIATVCAYAFYNCREITKIVFPDSVMEAGGGFCMNSGVREVVLPGELTGIPNSAFSYCRNLMEITVPEKAVSIGNNAFSGCTALTDVRLNDGLKEIGRGCFEQCENLGGIILPEGLEKIGPYAFFHSGLQRLTLPDTVLSIGASLCQECEQLRSVTLSSSLKEIPSYAFAGCALTYVNHFPKNVEVIGEAAFLGNFIESHIVPGENLKQIGRHAFTYANLTLPAGDVDLEDEALGFGPLHVIPGSYCEKYCRAFGLRTE